MSRCIVSPDVEPRQGAGRRLWSGERSGKVSGKVRKERQHLSYGVPPPSDKGVEGDRP